MEEAFKKIVEHVFGNWSAMQLAVEHSMGGPNSKQTATDTINHMVTYCLSQRNVEVESIEDTLEDVMDQHFNTICEDGSVKEVSDILYKFLQLLRQGDFEQCESEYSKLPVNNGWVKSIPPLLSSEDIPDDEEIRPSMSHDPDKFDCEELMESEEPGWTKVSSKRKK